MLRRLRPNRHALVVTALFVGACPGRPDDACNDDGDCNNGAVCENGACVVVGRPSISGVDGDGDPEAPVPIEGVTTPADAVASEHRVRDALVVAGTNLRRITRAELQTADGVVLPLTIETDSSEEADVRRRLSLASIPSSSAALVRSAAVTLVVASVGGEARAQVFLLQGEAGANGDKGDKGDKGDPGEPAASLTPTFERVANAADCAGGPGLSIGFVDDVGAAVGAGGVVCDGAAGSGAPDDVIRSDLTLHVPSEFPTIVAALSTLGERHITPLATVTVEVAAGTHDEPGILLTHPDGLRIHIVGAGSASTTLRFQSTGINVNFGGDLGLLQGVTLLGPGANVQADGLVLSEGAVAEVADVVVRGFFLDVAVVNNSFLTSSGALACFDTNLGLDVERGATVALQSLTVQGSLGRGVLLHGGADGFFGDVALTSNAVDGVGVSNSSSATIANGTVASNGLNGIVAAGASSVTLGSAVVVTGNCTNTGGACGDSFCDGNGFVAAQGAAVSLPVVQRGGIFVP